MSSTTDFISELVRAANEIYSLSQFERVRLIERAATTIQSQRDLLVAQGRVIPLSFDITTDLQEMRKCSAELPEVLSAAVMLKCAEEIMRLKILVSAAG